MVESNSHEFGLLFKTLGGVAERIEPARRLQIIRLATYRNKRPFGHTTGKHSANARRPLRFETNHSLRQPRERTNQERSSSESTYFRSVLRLSAADERQANEKEAVFTLKQPLDFLFLEQFLPAFVGWGCKFAASQHGISDIPKNRMYLYFS